MVYRMQPTLLGATKKEKKEEKKALRQELDAARDEWKNYVASLNNLVFNLRKGALPSDQGLPQPPSTPAEMAPDQAKKAKNILEKELPAAYAIAGNLDKAARDRAATSSYAAGQPPVSPGGDMTTSYIPAGDLPGNVQQPITTAYGVSPVLQESGAPSAYTQTPVQSSGGANYTGQYETQEVRYLQDGSATPAPAPSGFPLKKILLVVGAGVALWLAYRWWKKRK